MNRDGRRAYWQLIWQLARPIVLWWVMTILVVAAPWAPNGVRLATDGVLLLAGVYLAWWTVRRTLVVRQRLWEWELERITTTTASMEGDE